MEKRCAWCKCPLGHVDGTPETNGTISHGICEACAKRLLSAEKTTIRDFLDQFDFPVLLTAAGDTRARVANRQACRLLGKELEQIEGSLGGDMIECVYARQAGGCGQHAHCQGCTIRKSVTYTFQTGKPLHNVPTTAEIMPQGTMLVVNFLISTEKAGDCVLVRIEKTSKCKPVVQ